MRKYLVFLSLFLFAFSCEKQDSQFIEEEIIILHTNDMHANLSNMPRLAFVVDSIENLYDDVFLFSGGDIFSGNPIVDMYNDKGYPIIKLMNRIGYDLSVIGNHEFDYGQDFLNKRMAQAQFPFICANVTSAGGEFVPPSPFVKLLTAKNTEIAVLGLIENFSDAGLPATHPLKVEGLNFQNPFETAQNYKNLDETSDVFIALSHLGFGADKVLADEMPEIDFIIGGHSHTTLNQIYQQNGVKIVQAGSKFRFVGELKLKLQNKKIIKTDYKLINLTKGKSIVQSIADEIHIYNENPVFKEVIAYAEEELGGKEELGALFTDGLTYQPEIEIAFQNDGGIRIGSIPQGDITMLQILEMDPFGNGLMALEMTTNEIRSLIKGSFHGGIGLRVSGIKYKVFEKDNKAVQIQLMNYDGSLLDQNKTYQVGISDFIFYSYEFNHQNEPKNLGITTAESIIQFLKEKQSVNYSGVRRTFVEEYK